jgi:tripartite-type tricarboxylate transporter receptor subunit TctC
MCEPTLTGKSQIQSDTVKAIAFLGAGRTSVLPTVATAAEQGFSKLVISGWNALFLPKGTAYVIAQRFSAAVSQTLDTVSIRERIESLGDTVPPREERTCDYLARFLPAEIKKWEGPIKAIGASVE